MFIEILATVKIFHWNTKSYAQHKATDELYSRLNEHIDSFVEVFLGKDQTRIPKLDANIPLLNYHSNADSFLNRIDKYRDFVMRLDSCITGDTDLQNIRDEILGDINQFRYLLSFDK